MSYPFGIHSKHSIPWNYQSIDDAFYLQAKSCQKLSSMEGGMCGNCQKLTSSTLFSRIMARIRFGTNENVLFMYHGVGALIAIARWKTDQIEQLWMSKLNDIYVLLQLGGACVAQFAHQSLALPILMTIRCQTVLPALVVSPSTPTVADVEANVISYLWQASDKPKDKVVHQVLLFDELAIEKCHNNCIPLDFISKRELDILCEAIANNEVHLATEVTVAAIGILLSEPCEYAVQPILFSGTCKKETSEQHAHIIKTVLEACNRQKNDATYYGEAKCGDALIIQMMSLELLVDSLIYTLLCPLDFLNLLVGPDDITTDKDFKVLIKHQWNLFMQAKGIEILGYCIMPSVLCSQLEINGVLVHQLQLLLNPNDKQDVTCDLAFALACDALNIYGKFAQHLMLPYICVNQDLNEQLTHLSAATHLAFLLYCHNSAATRFMSRQSYLDIVLMIKNAYFCVAKMKIDNPNMNFYLISLGTDHLETFFGLICTAVGTDSNHPKWDYGMHCMSLPVFSKETQEFTSKADHINPRDWHRNISVANDLITDAADILSSLSVGSPSIDMMSPFGELLVNQCDETEDTHKECNALEVSNQDLTDKGQHRPKSVPYMHEGNIEDAIADEAPHTNATSEILIQGQKTTKAKALQHRMATHSSQLSTDHLKQVQQLPCFESVSRVDLDIITSSNNVLGMPSLHISNPIAVLVQCKNLVVLAVAQINQLKFAGKDNLSELPIHLLADPTAKVDLQILCLVPATLNDDPTQMEALCDNIPGQGVHLINPSLSVQKLGKPTFLFESTFLVTLSCNLFQELRPQDQRNLPVIKQTEHFPYWNPGGACFICEVSNEASAKLDRQADCSRCGPPHMGAHIMFDMTLNTSEEYCGLCLCPLPMCQIYLNKGCGTSGRVSVDLIKSTCPNLVSHSSDQSPCSNIPVICPLCPAGSPAVWTYSLHSHYCRHH
ncbi:hypothetical protein V8E53_003216 [Lactarius tabidus]